MKLEQIGFYTLNDERAARVAREGVAAPLSRCELLITGRCNFRCPYCRRIGGQDIPQGQAEEAIERWAEEMLGAIWFSGGEPTLHPGLLSFVELARGLDIERVALSTNGSADLRMYEALLQAGVNDLSISLDACCAEDGDRYGRWRQGSWEHVVENIRALAGRVYLTVGVVLTHRNGPQALETVELAASLGASDIRVIPAAQEGSALPALQVSQEIRKQYSILDYRLGNIERGVPVRGIGPGDCRKCSLVLDDMAAMGGKHYPCIIYLREGGDPIGDIGPGIRDQRRQWFEAHDSATDPICSRNCLDVCVAYNNRVQEFRP